MIKDSYRRRRKKKHKKLDIKRFAKLIRFISVLILGVMAFYLFSQSPFFAVQRIEGKGLQHLSLSGLIQESGLSKGQNIFRIDTAQVRRRLTKDPLIERVEVKRLLPHTIVIEVTERQPRALFLAKDTLLVIDRAGYCLDKISAMRSYNLPVITGIKPGSTELGKRVSSNKEMMSVLAVLDPELQNFFSEFNISGKEQIIAYSRDGVPILLGSSDDLKRKLQVAVSLLENLSSPIPVEYVDVRAVNAPAIKYHQPGGTTGEKLYNTDKT